MLATPALQQVHTKFRFQRSFVFKLSPYQGLKKRVFLKPNPVGFIGFGGFIGVFWTSRKNR